MWPGFHYFQSLEEGRELTLTMVSELFWISLRLEEVCVKLYYPLAKGEGALSPIQFTGNQTPSSTAFGSSPKG